MVKPIVVHPYHGILFNNKKEKNYFTHNPDEFPENCAELKKSIPKGYTQDSTYVTFLKWQDYSEYGEQNLLWRIDQWLPEVKDTGEGHGMGEKWGKGNMQDIQGDGIIFPNC